MKLALLEITFFDIFLSPDFHEICTSREEFALLACNTRVSDCFQALMVSALLMALQLVQVEQKIFGHVCQKNGKFGPDNVQLKLTFENHSLEY